MMMPTMMPSGVRAARDGFGVMTLAGPGVTAPRLAAGNEE